MLRNRMSPLDCAPCESQVKLVLGGKILAYPSQSFLAATPVSKIQHCNLDCGVSVQFWASDLFMQISVTEAEASRSEACSQLFGEGSRGHQASVLVRGHPQAKELVCDCCRRRVTQEGKEGLQGGHTVEVQKKRRIQ